MNWDIVKGKWSQIQGEVRKEWGNLTDDDYEQIGGEKDKLVGKLQEKYGWLKNDAELRVDEWVRHHSEKHPNTD